MSTLKPRVRDDLVLAELDGELVVYDPVSDHLHHFNREASLVFALLDGTATVQQTALDLADVFGLPAVNLQAQVSAACEQFRDAHLLSNGADKNETADPMPAPAGLDSREVIRRVVPRDA